MIRIYPIAELWFGTEDCPSFLAAPIIMVRYQYTPETRGIVLKRSVSTTTVIDLGRSYEEIRQGYNRRTKRGLNKFERTELEMRSDGLTPDQIYAEVEAFVKRKGYTDPPKKRVYRARWPHFQYNYVVDPSNGTIVCLQVYYVEHGIMRSLYITNNEDYADVTSDASRAMHDDIIRKNLGKLDFYDMGGVVLDENDARWGISQFKMGFGGETRKTYSYVAINV